MRFFYYILAVTYLLALLGLYSVTLVPGVPPGLIILTGAALLTSLAFNVRRKRIIASWLWNFIALLLLAFFLAEYFLKAGDLVVSAAGFLTVLMAAKLFDLSSNRDYIIVYGSSFFLILAAAASTVSLIFLPLLVVFIVAVIFAMILINLRVELNAQEAPGTEPPPGIFDLPFFISLVVLTAVSIAVTFALFLIIPRMEVGLLHRKTLNTIKVSGFSDTVELGSIGAVKKDPTVVMRVELPGIGRPVKPLYFRGAVLEDYKDGVWKRAPRRSVLMKKASGIFILGRPALRPVELKILLEPIDTVMLFTAGRAVRLSARFKNLWTDSTGGIYLPSPLFSRIQYSVWSEIDGTLPEGKTDLVRPSRIKDAPIQNTPEPAERRIRAFAKEITEGRTGALEKASAIRDYLHRNYKYTLDPGRGEGLNPIDDFLFYTKEGYCEQFATAFIILARAAGVDARLVTGFLEGEWNGLGRYFIVRQSDAHTWAEVLEDGVRWKRFDPTPSIGLKPAAPASRLSLYIDYLSLRWSRYVINYTSLDQRRFALGLTSGSKRFLSRLKDRLRDRVAGGAGYAVTIAVIIVLTAGTYLMLKRRRTLEGRASSKTPPFYTRMLKILKSKGLTKDPGETPTEFALRVGGSGVLRVTGAFELCRYGGRAVEPDDMRWIDSFLRGLKRSKGVEAGMDGGEVISSD